MSIPFVGRRFRPADFPAYLAGVTFGSFRPRYVTLHHTGIPNLAQRPTGFSDQHLLNLRHYYGVQLGWSGAPHFFVDDRDDGIIVFQRLDRKGVHAASFNNESWGIEMLGNYDVDSFTTGRGEKIRDLTVELITMLNERLGASPTSLRFHRDDPLTSKSCPGRNVSKADMVTRLAAALGGSPPIDTGPANTAWSLTLPDGSTPVVRTKGGRPIALARAVLDSLRPGGTYRLLPSKIRLEWTIGGVVHPIDAAELDESGKAWARVRDLVETSGRTLSVDGKRLTVM